MSITARKKKTGRYMAWSILLLLVVLVLPLIPYATSASNGKEPNKVQSPAVELWNNVRQRDGVFSGTTQMRSMDAGVLISKQGQEWREYRMTKLIPYSSYIFGAILIAIAAYFLLQGRIRITKGRSGKKILRFTINQRTAHWLVAIMFVLLAITGMILLYGRFVLIPLLGPEGFGVTGQIAKTIHDYVGPVFGIALIIQFILFVRGNIFEPKTDLPWLLKGGGMLGKQHAPAGCYNAGEKIWFWVAMTGGAVMLVSGIILDFPFFDQDRSMLELNYMIHTIAAVIVVAMSFGHIYLGSVGMEGAFEAMKTGYCDENWAKEHHEIWYENIKNEPGRKQAVEDVSGMKSSEQAST